ncbi:nucleolar protein 14 [Sporodiniella umbellata]|nr:nucleolar protein 14 [Sporodiniella umbellata]
MRLQTIFFIGLFGLSYYIKNIGSIGMVKQTKTNSGGSALKRLKKSLTSAGVVGQQAKASRSKKDRKKGMPTERLDLDKKLNHIRGEFNPFEKKVQKEKFEILGRKMKGSVGKPTLSKQVGEENRKKTLLVEMKNKHRRGGVIDKRFGESNPHLTPEEKMLERFTKEKQRSARGSMYNLADDDEDITLTHYGQSLSTMDDFDDAGLALSDEDEGKQMDKNIVSKLHFGGFDDEEAPEEEERHKSKHEIMKEIIAKSKLHKAERQAAKAEDEELRETLDDELNDIRDLLETKPARKPLPSQTAMFRKSESEHPEKELEDYSEYDLAMMELASDRRAMATDRTKTEEEVALEEKEKLEKAEKARKRRMEGLESESEDEDHKKGRKKKKSVPQGDDLEDDYLGELEEDNQLGQGLTLEDIQKGGQNEESEEESGDEEDDENEDNDDEDGDDEEDDETDNEDLEGSDSEEITPFESGDEEDMNEIGSAGVIKKEIKANGVKKSGKREIPFTFECPTSHDAFLGLLEGLEVEDSVLVTQRIRVLHHIKLNPENKAKLAAFLGVLVDHTSYIASTVSPLPVEVLEKLGLHIFEISQQVPEASADVFTEKLRRMQNEMGKKMKFNSGSSLPDVEDLIALRHIGQIFSTSDLQHSISTPAHLFICHALAQGRIQTELDMGRGLFLTQILYEYQRVSKRYAPEALNFLYKNLVLLAPEGVLGEDIPGYFPLDKTSGLGVEESEGQGLETVPGLLLEDLSTENEQGQDRLSLVQASLRQLEKYLQLYASTPAFKEVFEGLLLLVQRLKGIKWHEDIKSLLNTLEGRLERQIKFCIEKRTKTPLRMQQHRPIPIAQHLPKFEKAYSMDRHYDPDHERAQLHKLETQVKKEKKGALRELRKDNQFMAREKAKERKQKDEDYNKMVNSVMHLLEGEQSEMKQLEREKSKK